MEIRHIEPTDIRDLSKKRVAAYARVSSDKDAAENSLESQIAYYAYAIREHPEWEFVGMYADEGISGTKENRPEFQKLLADARAGKIDIVITKSVSRFARNLVLLLDCVRELKALGIEVVFENDHISSLSKQGELLLSLLASHAEDQSRSASENKRWQIQRYFENGQPTYFRMYGYNWIDGHLEIIPEEAEIVRRIFAMYLDGMGREAIAHKLNSEGILTNRGKPWQSTSIYEVIRNEKYTGDMKLQKWRTPDFRTKKQHRNKGEWGHYYVSGSHEPIIDLATFEAAQAEIARRKTVHATPQKDRTDSSPTLFCGILKCGLCGSPYRYKNQWVKTSQIHTPIWRCGTYVRLGKNYCSAKQIRESILVEKTKEVLGLSQETELTRDLIVDNFTAIESAAGNRLRFYRKDGRIDVVEWQNPSRSQSWTPEMKQKAKEKSLEANKRRKEVAYDNN